MRSFRSVRRAETTKYSSTNTENEKCADCSFTATPYDNNMTPIAKQPEQDDNDIEVLLSVPMMQRLKVL